MGRVCRIVLWLPRVAGLNREVPAVPIQAGPVNYVLTIGVEAIALAIEPVLEVTDEEVLVADAEEVRGDALAVLEAGVDGVQQFPLTILLAEDVFMGPSVPVGDRFSPGGAGDEVRQFHSLSIFLTWASINFIADLIYSGSHRQPEMIGSLRGKTVDRADAMGVAADLHPRDWLDWTVARHDHLRVASGPLQPHGEGGEESGTQFALGDTFDEVRAGARLVLSYDSATNAFTGTVENTTRATLSRVRVEVHLSNGIELGPTTPVDLAPGQVVAITLPASSQPFTSWSAHTEVG